MTRSPAILRLTAPNAGAFTHNGTNTYLLGTDVLAVVDPGPVEPAHLAAILRAAGGRPVTHILLTHAHRDHADGVAALKSATGAVTCGMARVGAGADVADSPSGGEFITRDFSPEIILADGAKLVVGDIEVEAIHTPGHAPDHLCFAIFGTPVLLSGDHVMGWSTSVIAPPEGNMGDYLRSLECLLARAERRYLPGHGDEITDGPRTARAYLLHRQVRERAILDAVRAGAGTTEAITAIVYAGIASNLLAAARASVRAHLELLADKRAVVLDPDWPAMPAVAPAR
jgi:glyoxylase-like metal-dependent hydrolase (beta-lactamase superfamily II)